ncbi:MAG: molybdenum cofactor biosynthesis protein MoaE [Armatimonadota bacterium]|nr:molybdenum cofactor biosynthesis protein MoaE [Armatimonadota bacterium]MDR7563410.1 molybdenum cofactor biosynthesis protein MoaE [Armatimonadota bacterium]MDR7568929.1 molybdenum cofactor biosynthesis protein MoaE [Armatimonadota bacterium]
MQVRVRLFAVYREAVGTSLLELSIDDTATPASVWRRLTARFPALHALPTPRFAVQDEYVSETHLLRDGDEVVLIPPVSGGADAFVDLTEMPIPVEDLLRRVQHPHAGAVVLFLGTVRQNTRGQQVLHLDYEAYGALARKEMLRIAEEIMARWPVLRVAMVHRLGRLEVGEISVAVAVSAPHRREAFEAGRYAIDTLKVRVPIWKKEVWTTGARWVGVDEPSTL